MEQGQRLDSGEQRLQWPIVGQRRGDGSKRSSVGVRQNNRGWAGSDVGAKGHGNREVEAEE